MQKSKPNQIGVGIFLIIAGVVLLFVKLDILYMPAYIFSWPMILIAIGLYNLFVSRNIDTGLVFSSVGTLFLIGKINDLRFWEMLRYFADYWPILLIIAGVGITTKTDDYNG